MNNIKKTRDSNIELLRIISMIMIVVHHYEMYAGFTNSGNLSLNSYMYMLLNLLSSFHQSLDILFLIVL